MGEGVLHGENNLVFTCISFNLMVTVLISYCCITNYYQLSGLKQHKIINSQCYRSEIQAQRGCVLCSGSHRTEMKVLVRAVILLEAPRFLVIGRFQFLEAGGLRTHLSQSAKTQSYVT